MLRLVRLALPLLIAPTATLLLASLYDPMYLDRYVLYSQLALALLIGVAVDRLWDTAGRTARPTASRSRAVVFGTAAAGVVVALLPVTLQMRTPDSRKDDVTAIAAQVRTMASDDAGVLFMPATTEGMGPLLPGRFPGPGRSGPAAGPEGRQHA